MTRRRILLALLSGQDPEWCVCLAVGPMPMSPATEWLRVHITTCADVRTVVAAVGEAKAEAVARAAGMSERQIKDARRCLTSSSNSPNISTRR